MFDCKTRPLTRQLARLTDFCGGAVRNALRSVDGLPALGILGIILRSREQARFGDRVAGTRVVKVC